MRRCIAALCVVVVALLPACSRNKPPNSLFDAAGYHVRGEKVYYLNAFPGNAFEINGADAASFHAFDATYARDSSAVYFDGHPIPDADASSFQVLDRPGFAKDRRHVYQLDRPISDDPTHFELLDASLSRDSAVVYWSDGGVLSDDPAHFVILSNTDHYLFTKDSHTVHVNGNPIAGADPATFHVLAGAYAQDRQRIYYFSDSVADVDAPSFRALDGPYAVDVRRAYWMGKAIQGANPAMFRVLNAAFECSADAEHAYYRQSVITNADPHSFPPDRAVTGCTETSISFAD
ncbi:DKNYY domain-containing protein [Mycobacterium sp.]|uniref:DKNYY domain-containing protein n=1 Tax=Mycobacterium sp. TaxID=1785 RepID=UPI002CBD625E|nr:DKNYY domain-containing protein [Mycobacterium sp.]HKP42920.1 DKNYY domain-containing protein [Mycobacterium sp.]